MPDRPLRITVLLSGSGTTFAAIESASRHPDSGYTISHVISDSPTAYGLTRATTAGCTANCVNYRDFDSRANFNAALLEAVKATEPDLVVLAGFMRIVDTEFVQAFDGKLLNIHPSLLPAYPGLNTYERVLASADKEHGTTVHFVNDVLDGGPLIAQAVVNIEASDTPQALSARVQAAERTLYPTVIHWFASGRLRQNGGQVWLDSKRLEHPLRGTVNIHSEEYELHD